MDRLRRSLRESFRRKKEHVPECSKPHQWQADEAAVRSGTCSFSVKYLGCVEVFESRGMQVCEEALKVLRNSRRRPIKGILYVTGDGLRVVEDETKGLIVDQTIEKVSFCAPDRNHDKGFSYICRDGTTRRWMCHGFLAVKDSGERLSHAVGCAFAACLERKQKRDKECGVTMTFDPNNATFTRTGSFRQSSLTERMQDPQECKPTETPPVKPVHNPFAIERPHATASMLQRQGSFRGFSHLSQSSPFKRQLSLRLNELPSTLERQRSLSLESSDFSQRNGPASPQLPVRVPRNRLHSLPNAVNMSPIIENLPVADKQESLSALCQQVTQGLSLLSNTEDPFVKAKQSSGFVEENNHHSMTRVTFSQVHTSKAAGNTTQPNALTNEVFEKYTPQNQHNYIMGNHVIASVDTAQPLLNNQPMFTSQSRSTGHVISSSTASNKAYPHAEFDPPTNPWATESKTGQSAAEAWLASASTAPPGSSSNEKIANQPNNSVRLNPSPRRAPHLVHLRSQSLGETQNPRTEQPWANGTSRDPFDAEWAALATHPQQNTNPFQQSSMKAFEVQL